MPPKLIFRYIFGLHLRYTLLGLGLVLLVVFLGQFADAARHLGGQADWSSAEMLARAALRTPMLLQYVLPHVLLVSAAFAIYRLGCYSRQAGAPRGRGGSRTRKAWRWRAARTRSMPPI